MPEEMRDLDKLVDRLSEDERVRTLCQQPLPREFNYTSLSAALLDAIFSIGVHYAQVTALISRHKGLRGYDPWYVGSADPYPLPDLIREGRKGTPMQFAEELGNNCRTSTRSGILKAEAVILAAEALVKHAVVDMLTWRSASEAARAGAERDFRRVRGQSTGISWKYFCMLAGNDDEVKPDRMIIRYVGGALGREPVAAKLAGELVIAAATALRGRAGYPQTLTARHLDTAIWGTVRSRP